ncbi:UDP-N-acetylmuramate--L-alanine ligase [Coprothermobacteraceae bacterium]|nr:UDP-N-acetylmuramate--L-alanine ligase [Coprothermobacteraceae bacterium]
MGKWTGHYHFIAVGGIGMSALAYILGSRGVKVSGCDLDPNFYTRGKLEAVGVQVFEGHDPKHLANVDYAVYSTAIRPEYPEYREALRLGIPLLHRSEILADLMNADTSIGVTGAHGKSSTTAFIGQAMALLGMDPTFIGGAIVSSFQGNARNGSGPVVAEVDESDGSLVRIPASIKVVLNVDNDHLDHYGSMEALEKAIISYAEGLPHHSVAVLNYEDGFLRAMDVRSRRVYWYGRGAPDFALVYLDREGLSPRALLSYQGREYVIVNRHVVGVHNGWNLGAAFAALVSAGINPQDAAAALEEVEAPQRRQQVIGMCSGTLIMDDYAHHPNELKALRHVFEGTDKRVLLVFQPHRYTRYKLLFEHFAEELSQWPSVALTEIYRADEPEEQTSSYTLFQQLKSKHVWFTPTKEDVLQLVRREIENYDVVLFAGAGSISRWAHEFVEACK